MNQPKTQKTHNMTKSKIKNADSMKQAAGILGRPLSELKAAKQAGCPAFAGSRVNLPELARWLGKPAKKHKPNESANDGLGAGPALQRLEAVERELFQAMREQMSAGSPAQADAARAAWLEVNEQLRRLDRQLADSRRIVGEAIPRSEVERSLKAVSNWLQLALSACATAVADAGFRSPAFTATLVRRAMHDALAASVEMGVQANAEATRVPKWIADAILAQASWPEGYTDQSREIFADYIRRRTQNHATEVVQ